MPAEALSDNVWLNTLKDSRALFKMEQLLNPALRGCAVQGIGRGSCPRREYS